MPDTDTPRDWSWLPVWYSAIVSPEQCEDNERWAESQEGRQAVEHIEVSAERCRSAIKKLTGWSVDDATSQEA
jgi:hypothetical protein